MQSLKHLHLLWLHTLFRARRRLGYDRQLFDMADKAWEIAPEETRQTPPSVFLPGEFDKITGLETGTTIALERTRAFGGAYKFPGLKAYRFSDAVMYQGAIFAKGAQRRVLPLEATPPPASQFRVLDIENGALSGSYLGLKYFGHWLHDDTPLSLLAESHGDPYSPRPKYFRGGAGKGSHIPGYTEFLGIPWKTAENIRFKSLTVFYDEGFTTHKIQRLQTLRDRASKRLGTPVQKKRIFLMRGMSDGGARQFQNEEALAAALSEEGFFVINPAASTFEEIAQTMHGAELVVGAEGSQLSHAVYFLRSGGALLAITPPDTFNTPHKLWTDPFDIQYGFSVGDREEKGFSANIDDVKRTIDLFRL